MGKHTRKNNILMNTEFNKVNRSTGDVESDLREMSGERLMEILSKGTLADIKKSAKECKVNANGSKFDILGRIKKILDDDVSSFGKLFTKLGGHNGGWLTFSCVHGITYYLKVPVRSESPRDYVDGLLSMKYIPNVIILDMPQIVARHGNGPRRRPDVARSGHGNEEGLLFFPFQGRAGDYQDPETLRSASEGNFCISLPWISGLSKDKCENQGPLVHPVTGSSDRLCLFDRLHENNANSELENLRKIRCIKELDGFANSEVLEQLHKHFKGNARFLNSMKPVNFMHLLRSMLNHRNKLKNEQFLHDLSEKHEYTRYNDEYGRVRFMNVGFIYADGGSKNRLSADVSDYKCDSNRGPLEVDSNIDSISDNNVVSNVSVIQDYEPLAEDTQIGIQTSKGADNKNYTAALSESIDFNILSCETNIAILDNYFSKAAQVGEQMKYTNEITSNTDEEQEEYPKPSFSVENNDEHFARTSDDGSVKQSGNHATKMNDIEIENNDLPNCSTRERSLLNKSPSSLEEIGLLSTDLEITDKIINAAQSTIKKFSTVNKLLQPAGLCDLENPGKPFPRINGNFVQIIKVSQNHYVTISNIYWNKVPPKTPTICIYDSYISACYRENEEELKYPIELACTSSEIINTRGDRNLQFQVQEIIQSSTKEQSGYYAILFAYCIYNGIDPLLIKLLKQNISSDIHNFLQFGTFTKNIKFLVNTKIKERVYCTWNEKLYCLCYQTDNGEHFDECEECSGWYHTSCVKLITYEGKTICRPCYINSLQEITQEPNYIISDDESVSDVVGAESEEVSESESDEYEDFKSDVCNKHLIDFINSRKTFITDLLSDSTCSSSNHTRSERIMRLKNLHSLSNYRKDAKRELEVIFKNVANEFTKNFENILMYLDFDLLVTNLPIDSHADFEASSYFPIKMPQVGDRKDTVKYIVYPELLSEYVMKEQNVDYKTASQILRGKK